MNTPHPAERGMATPLVLAVMLLVAAVVGGYYFTRQKGDAMMKKDAATKEKSADVMMSPSPSAMMKKSPDVMMKKSPDAMMFKAGIVNEYTAAAYADAVASGKVVVLYYYANWCPICRTEFPKFAAAVGQLNDSRVVAFRVNYNDSETTDEETASAKQFQVGYQHTVVIVKGGTQAYKAGNTADYAATIQTYLK